jgi:hypothetical protein
MIRTQVPVRDFELFYLVELTRQKMKPLSRWEKPLDERSSSWVRDQGLILDVIPRKTLLRKEIHETIFSTSSRYVDLYRRRFFNSPVRKDPTTQRIEGHLFGYPHCCVEHFVQHPYSHNGFPKEDQAVLFHWACLDCRATRALLPYYRSIYKEAKEWYEGEMSHRATADLKSYKRVHKKLAFVASIALMLFSRSLSGQTVPDTTHFIPVSNDIDNDGLTYAEEFYLGTEFSNSLSQTLTVNDGEFWSRFFNSMVDTLPTTPQQNQPYKTEHPVRGIELCQKCGATVNMGYVTLVNPMRGLQSNIPFIGLHYLENGCFSYWGDVHRGRVEIDTLKKILYSYDQAHMLPVVGDRDGDGLTDAEEDSLYLNPNDPDTDGDGVVDGAQVAEQLSRLFPKLKEQADNAHSSINFLWMDGLENCQVCGSAHNMGFIEFQNPENGRTQQVHFNGLHAIAHGSFAYDGTKWSNQRADAVETYRVMKTHMLFVSGDSDNDGLTDVEESHFGFDPNLQDSDGDGVCDGMELALALTTVLDSLPTSPVPNAPYVLHHPTFGSWNCLLCGEPINMGFMEVLNSSLGGDPLQITYYAYHFLKKGSFAYEGRIGNGLWLGGRVDPIRLAEYVDYATSIQSESTGTLPEGFVLKQNYPNPFNLSTNIKYQIPSTNHVTLKVFDVLGREVATLVSKEQEAGSYQVQFDGTGLASGVYFYRMKMGEFVQSKKLLLLR